MPELEYSEFGKRLRSRIADQRIPIRGSLELTFRCNLRCAHCYVSHGYSNASSKGELSYAEICNVVDQIVDEGCLWLLLTGGEPLLRPDFLDIYTYAKRKGLIVTLFTNGTLMTPHIADYLADLPPHKVEISLYGRTQQTYERVTGIPGSYDRCMRGIDLLLERNIPLDLKTVLITLNQHELDDIRTFTEDLGMTFRFDPMINAGVDDVNDPTVYRLSPEEIVQYDIDDEKRSTEFQKFCGTMSDLQFDQSSVYVCGAGVTAFNVDPYGKLSTCMMARTPSYDLRQGDLPRRLV